MFACLFFGISNTNREDTLSLWGDFTGPGHFFCHVNSQFSTDMCMNELHLYPKIYFHSGVSPSRENLTYSLSVATGRVWNEKPFPIDLISDEPGQPNCFCCHGPTLKPGTCFSLCPCYYCSSLWNTLPRFPSET